MGLTLTSVAGLALLTTGCWVAYHPAVAVAPVAGAHVTGVDTFGPRVSVDVAPGTEPGQRIGDGRLTTPDLPPCASGVPASEQYPRAVHADQRSFDFDTGTVARAGLLARAPTLIDVDLLPAELGGTRRCLRLPVTSAGASAAAPEWVAFPRWFISTSLRTVGTGSGANAVEAGALVSFGGGIWAGPVRLRLDWLFGEARTNRPPPPGFSTSRVQLLGGAAAAELFPLQIGPWAAGLQLGYEYLAVDFHSEAGSSSNDVYQARGAMGPRAALRLARLPWPRRWPGFRARHDAWSLAVDLYVARWTGVDGLAPMRYGIAFGAEVGKWW
jgi:hypothetical protein